MCAGCGLGEGHLALVSVKASLASLSIEKTQVLTHFASKLAVSLGVWDGGERGGGRGGSLESHSKPMKTEQISAFEQGVGNRFFTVFISPGGA